MFSSSRLILLVPFLLKVLPFSLLWAVNITALASLLAAIVATRLTSVNFLKLRWDRQIIPQFLSFSGWMGITKILFTILSRIDIQMVMWFLGPIQAGIYSVAARLASFYYVIALSFNSVLAPKLATGKSFAHQKNLISKAFLVIGGLIGLMFLGVLISPLLIKLLFGSKALPAVSMFQGLTISFMPYMISSLFVTLLVYLQKKPHKVTISTSVQFIVYLIGNILLLPKFGVLGLIITTGLANTITMLLNAYFVFSNTT